MSQSVALNIGKLYFFQAVISFLLVMPIIVLFFQDNGLSLQQIFWLQSFFSIWIVLLEIPSGYFADRVGRREAMLFGTSFAFLGFSIYPLASEFWHFCGVEWLLAIGFSCISGADSALIYDTLLETGRESEYKKIEGRMLSIKSFSQGVAAIVGGFLAVKSLYLPFYVEAVVLFFAVPIAYSLVEPKRRKLRTKRGRFQEILDIVKYSLHGHNEVKWLILYAAVVTTSTLVMVWFAQPYFLYISLPLAWFGIVWAVLQFSISIFALMSHRIEAYLGKRTSLISLVVLAALGYFLLGAMSSLWALGALLIFYFLRAFSLPVLRDYVNALISSDKRATVMSVKNMVGRLLFVALGPILGWVADVYTLSFALTLSGGIFLTLGLVALGFLYKHRAL